jgi:hypothetical protein
LLAVIFEGGNFNRVRTKTFLFDDDYDCFVYGATLFIRSPANFHRIFDYLQQLEARARSVLKMIRKGVPISNASDFEDACLGQPQMMAKLAGLAQRPYMSDLNLADCKRVIEEFGLDIEVVKEAGTEKLRFEAALDKRWLILKLLDDDFLNSSMTREKYETNSKVRR